MSLDLPNFTLVIQFVLFLAAFLMLYYWVFIPLLKVIEERRKKTIETFKNTEELSQKTMSLSHEYEDKLKDYRAQLKQKVDGERRELLKKQGQAIEETRQAHSKSMKNYRENIQKQIHMAEKELEKDNTGVTFR